MMRAKELKEMLADIPDDALILICNPQWKITEIEGYQLVKESPIYENQDVLYLDVKNYKR